MRLPSELPQPPSTDPRNPMPFEAVDVPEPDSLPPFSLMWLNNPDYAERPRFDFRGAAQLSYPSPYNGL
jgi:hypothetical protein